MIKESITWVHNGSVEISNHETQTSSNRKLQTISPSPGVGLNDELLGHSSGQSFFRYIFNELFILESGKNQCRNQNFLDKKCFAYHNNKSVSCLESCQGYGSFPDSSCCSFTGNPIKRRASGLESFALLTCDYRSAFWPEINTRIGSSALVWRKYRYWE